MRMQMVYLFPVSLFFSIQQRNQMNRLQKTLPAIAGGVALINDFVRGSIKQCLNVSLEISAGYCNVLSNNISHGARLCSFIQIMNRRLNLANLLLHNLLLRIRQSKDLNRDPSPFQSKDLVQDKGL